MDIESQMAKLMGLLAQPESGASCPNCGNKIAPDTGVKTFGGMFTICQPCDNAGKKFSRLLERGVYVEINDPKAGNTSMHLMKSR